jgi:hypothetical protein
VNTSPPTIARNVSTLDDAVVSEVVIAISLITMVGEIGQ